MTSYPPNRPWPGENLPDKNNENKYDVVDLLLEDFKSVVAEAGEKLAPDGYTSKEERVKAMLTGYMAGIKRVMFQRLEAAENK